MIVQTNVWILVAVAICGLVSITSVAKGGDPLDGGDTGFYGGQPNLTPEHLRRGDSNIDWSVSDAATPLEFFVHQTHVDRFKDVAYAESYLKLIKSVNERGVRFIPRTSLRFQGLEHFMGNVSREHIEAYKAGFDLYFASVNPDDLYAICLGEEHGAWGNTPAALSEVYDYIKQKWPKLKVFQWYSGPQIAGYRNALAKADGWVINNYGMSNPRYRRLVMHHVAMGKPVLACHDASNFFGKDTKSRPIFDNGIDYDWSDKYWAVWYEQMFAAREFDLPVFYFDQDQEGGMWGRFSNTPSQASINTALARRAEWLKTLPPGPFASAQFSNAEDAIEVAGDDHGKFEYVDALADSRFVRDATIDGFLNLLWEPGRLSLKPAAAGKSNKATLLYEFHSYFPIRSARAILEGASDTSAGGKGVEIAISQDGKSFVTVQSIVSGAKSAAVDLAGGEATFKRFWVRIRLDGGAVAAGDTSRLGRLLVSAEHEVPADKTIRLSPPRERSEFVAYTDDFARSNRWRHHAQITLDGATTPTAPGEAIPAVEGIAGRGAAVNMVYHFNSDKPLRNLKLTLKGWAHRDLGGDFRIAVSKDGQQWQHEMSGGAHAPRMSDINAVEGAMTLDLSREPEFTGVTQFWVKISALATAGVQFNNPAAKLTGFDVAADIQPVP